jgi:hexosaminidase
MRPRSIVVLVLFGGLLAAMLTLTGCLFSPQPHAVFTATPSAGYPPVTVHFDASGSTSPNGPITSYAWTFGDGTSAVGKQTSHTYTAIGTYTVTLTTTDSTGAVGSVSHQVIAKNHDPVASFTKWPYMAGVDQDFTFDASASYDEDGQIVQYLWNFGDGTTSAGMIVKHAYTSAGSQGKNYTVTLTVIDNDGGRGTAQQTVRVMGCDSCNS